MNHYKCPVCGFGYSGPVKPLSCPVCNSEMLDYASYKLHIAKAEQAASKGSGEAIYTCNHCLSQVAASHIFKFGMCPVCGNSNFRLPTVQPIADNQWLDDVSETKAWDMDEEDALVDREAFVHNLGVLLTQTREDVVKCELIDRGDTVIITFKGGGTRTVNVHADSYAAIIRDVMKQV